MNSRIIRSRSSRWLLALLLTGCLSLSAYGWWQSATDQLTQLTVPAVAGPVDGGGNGG